MFQIWPFKPKPVLEPQTLIEYKVQQDRSYLQFEHNGQKYVAFYTNNGEAGTSIYLDTGLSLSDKHLFQKDYITRININPLSIRDISHYEIASTDDFIEHHLKPIMDERIRLNSIRNQFVTN